VVGCTGPAHLKVARHDGINWAVLFNSDSDRTGKSFSDIIDPRCTGLPIRSRTAYPKIIVNDHRRPSTIATRWIWP
jgi:hypothetical protein